MKKYTFYKIVSKNPEIKDCYVGMTTDFSLRMSQHKGCCNNKNEIYNSRLYTFLRDNGGWEAWDMIEIEQREMESKHEVFKQEAEFIKSHGATLNTIIYSKPDRTGDWFVDSLKEMSSSSYMKTNPDLFSKKNNEPDEKGNVIIDYKDIIPSDLMPLFSGITGLDENYEKIIAPNEDEDYGLAKIIAKKYGSKFVCENIKKDIWYKINDDGEWSLCESKISVREVITTNFYEYIKDVLGLLKTNCIDKYDNEILNKYRIKTIISNIVKIMNGLHKTKKINKFMVELRILLYKEDFHKNQRTVHDINIVREFINDRVIPCEERYIIKYALINVFKEWYNSNYGFKTNNLNILREEFNKIYKDSNGVYKGITFKTDLYNYDSDSNSYLL